MRGFFKVIGFYFILNKIDVFAKEKKTYGLRIDKKCIFYMTYGDAKLSNKHKVREVLKIARAISNSSQSQPVSETSRVAEDLPTRARSHHALATTLTCGNEYKSKR